VLAVVNPPGATPNSGQPGQDTGNIPQAIRPGRPSTTLRRYVILDEKTYNAYVYGWRLGLTTKYNVPLQGVAIDNLLAVDSNPARMLEEGETLPTGSKIGNPDRKCPLCAGVAHIENRQASALPTKDSAGLMVQIGNTYYFFDSREHLHQVVEKLIKTQLVIGPRAGSTCDAPLSELIEQIKQDELLKAGIGAGNNGVAAGDF
jgi:hypothetical protein